jgi:AcrR family transcriptional regulator
MEGHDDLWPPWSSGSALRRDRRRGGPAQGDGRPGGPGQAPGGWPPGDRPVRAPDDRRGGPSRGRARQGAALSRDEIVDAAIAVADADGPEAVSMRRIAQVLRAGTMTLYWHVANKEHLLDLMLDALTAEIDVPQPSGDWQADLRAYALSNRATLLRHRWVIDFIGARPSFGPNTLRIVDRSLVMLDDLHLDVATAMTVLQAVNTYVTGAVLRESQEMRVQHEQEQSGFDEHQIRADTMAWREKLNDAGGFGHFIEILDQDVDPDAEETRADRFEFGLDCLLEGIAVKVRRLSDRGRA